MERTRLVPLPALIASAVLGGALLVGCQAQPLRPFPQDRYAIDNPYTDIDAYDVRDFRPDTEIPNQYPEGTTRSIANDGHEAVDEPVEPPYDAFEPDDPDGNAEQDTSILPDAIGTEAEQGEGEEDAGEGGEGDH